jgi:L-aminopeptidase/D-esterase-like protein
MNRKKPIGILFVFAVAIGATAWWLSTKFLILTVKRAATVQADSAPVVAEVLDGTSRKRVLTIRDHTSKDDRVAAFESLDTEVGDLNHAR